MQVTGNNKNWQQARLNVSVTAGIVAWHFATHALHTFAADNNIPTDNINNNTTL